MGYQPGKGLGKDLQGIQAPIEASLRKGRGAIGIYIYYFIKVIYKINTSLYKLVLIANLNYLKELNLL